MIFITNKADELKDLTGKLIGRWRVIERSENRNGQTRWLCECTCNNKTVRMVAAASLNTGRSKSCGCLYKENRNNYGKTNTRLYSIHSAIKGRCYNKNSRQYQHYGERGITVCEEWLNDQTGFINFYNWAMENGYSDDLTIDRIEVNGNYEPSNCKWATWDEQANNKRNNVYLEFNGETKTVTEWNNEMGFGRGVLSMRLKSGCDKEKLFKPVKKKQEIQSGIKGIIWHPKSKKWKVRLWSKGKEVNLGYFADLEDAKKVKERYMQSL